MSAGTISDLIRDFCIERKHKVCGCYTGHEKEVAFERNIKFVAGVTY